MSRRRVAWRRFPSAFSQQDERGNRARLQRQRRRRLVVEPLEDRRLLDAAPLGAQRLFPGEQYAVADSPRSVTAADVDGDGRVDLIMSNTFSDTVSVLRNLRDATFAVRVDYAVGIILRAMTKWRHLPSVSCGTT